MRHIKKIIDDNKLHENVRFTGRLSPAEMAQRMKRSHAFVMPSCVETHSSSLREAMSVGVPSVSTCVGSVPEFMHHGNNGFLYRYGEVQTLAHYIDKIFSNDNMSENIGKNAKQTIEEMFPQGKIGELILSAYRQIMDGGKGNE